MPKAKVRVGRESRILGVGRRENAVLDEGGVRVDSVAYDFSADGGAQSTIALGRKLPEGAIVTEITSDEITALTSGGAATVQLKAGSTDLSGAIAFDSGFTGVDAHALDGAVDGIKIPSDSELSVEIAAADLTAGKVRFFVKYLLSNDDN